MGVGFALTAYVSSVLGLAVTIAIWTARGFVTPGSRRDRGRVWRRRSSRGRYSGAVSGSRGSLSAVWRPLLAAAAGAGSGALWFTIGGVGPGVGGRHAAARARRIRRR
ncbi:hypothetical protein GCM10020220_038450 [Nonomuraea rubra]|uniref:hypothetical protein n=1 Tax=Nonomuraea rubra TaxID=46180 RepID=UPI0031E8A8CA